MLDKLKRLREAWQKKLAKFYEWHTEHAMQRKLIVSGTLVDRYENGSQTVALYQYAAKYAGIVWPKLQRYDCHDVAAV